MVPFSVSEFFFQFALLSVLYILFVYIFKRKKRYMKIAWLGVCVMFIMATSQGLSYFDCVPTVFRSHPSERLESVEISPEELIQFINTQNNLIDNTFDNGLYRLASRKFDLKSANTIISDALKFMSYPKGREVRRIKSLLGLQN